MDSLSDILRDAGLLTDEQAAAVREDSQRSGRTFGRVAVEKDFLSERQLVRALATHLEMRFVDLADSTIDDHAVMAVPEFTCRTHTVIPIGFEDGAIVLAMADPTNFSAIDEIRSVTGLPVKHVVATRDDVLSAIDRFNTDPTRFAHASPAYGWGRQSPSPVLPTPAPAVRRAAPAQQSAHPSPLRADRARMSLSADPINTVEAAISRPSTARHGSGGSVRLGRVSVGNWHSTADTPGWQLLCMGQLQIYPDRLTFTGEAIYELAKYADIAEMGRSIGIDYRGRTVPDTTRIAVYRSKGQPVAFTMSHEAADLVFAAKNADDLRLGAAVGAHQEAVAVADLVTAWQGLLDQALSWDMSEEETRDLMALAERRLSEEPEPEVAVVLRKVLDACYVAFAIGF